MQSTSWETLGWKKHKVESSFLGEIPITSKYADDTTVMAESEEELKRLLITVKEESEKVGLKLIIQKTKVMATGAIASWQIDVETRKQWQTLFSSVSKSHQIVTVGMKLKDACSLEEKLWQN